MRAVGEALGLGRTFAEAFLKAIEGREAPAVAFPAERRRARRPRGRARAPSAGTCCSRRRGAASTCRASIRTSPTACARCARAKAGRSRAGPRRLAVDSCAGEFEARTPYYYVTHEGDDEGPEPSGRAVIVLGGGPNRIGQAIEFDYCCVHAAQALRKLGYEAVLVNSNPETVSTDYDTSDRLYLEPLVERERARGLRARAARRRRRLLRRADAAAPRACARRGRRAAARRPARGDRRGRGSRPVRAARRRARAGVGGRRERRGGARGRPTGSAIRCSSARTT